MEIIGDPAATEEQWIPACAAVEREYHLQCHHQRAGAIGWLGAFIDSTITAISGCFLIVMSAISMTGSQPYCGYSNFEVIPVIIGIPFAFSFVYGLWMEHYKGGTAWKLGYFIPLTVVLAPLLLCRFPSPSISTAVYLLTAAFGALSGLQLGKRFFQRLRLAIKPWNVIGIGQLSLLAYPLLMFVFRESHLLLPVFVGICFMIGIFTSFTAKGKSITTTMTLAMVAIAMPVLMMLTVLLGTVVTLTAYTNPVLTLGICGSLVSLVCLTLAGAATGHWFLRYSELPEGIGGFKFDEPPSIVATNPSQVAK